VAVPIQDYIFQRYAFYDRKLVAAALAPNYKFQAQRGSWGISGIVRFGSGPNYVFFVSFGQKQSGHDFDEAVYANGILRWQSQPAQTLQTPTIQKLIRHDHLQNDILLFLRTKPDGPYAFMGLLKYANHDQERERPAHFHWQILEFDPTLNYESLMALKLQPEAISRSAGNLPNRGPAVAQILLAAPTPQQRPGNKGVGIATAEFRRDPVDYEERDRKNRRLGKIGEDLVFNYERARLTNAGRQDLVDRVEMVCRTMGDSAGFDVRSVDEKSGDEIHIEVKTTSGPFSTPFFMSAAEVEYAKSCPHEYRIYRVYDYSIDAPEIKFASIERPSQSLEFTPATFRVRQK
jgi:hypothetical protein